jgi:hypothetical protein
MPKAMTPPAPPAASNKSTTSEAPQPANEHALEDFAQDLGALLGQAQGKAERWLGQRQAIADHLVGVRDTATRLLAQLGIAEGPAPARRGGKPGSQNQPSNSGELPPAPFSKKQRRKRRTMSAEAREKIAAAQRARWAKWHKATK